MIFGGEVKRERLATARAYSRQTSGGRKLDIQQGGVNLRMSHQMLESGQGDAGPHHIRSEGVAKPVWIGGADLDCAIDDAGIASGVPPASSAGHGDGL